MKSTMIKDKILLEFDVGEYNKDLIDLLTMIEISNKSKASEKDIKNLSDEITNNWWEKNKKRFIDENNS